MTDRAVFPTPTFNRFWSAAATSALGSSITLLALPTLVVLTLDGDAQDVGLVNAARWLPYLLLGLVVGALVDRVRRRPVIVVTDLVRGASLTLVPIAWLTGWLSLPVLLGIVLCFGAASLVGDAAFYSLLPRLVPGRWLQRAHARIDATEAAAQSVGPALAGLVIKVVGAPLTFLVDAVSYAVSAALVLTIRVEEPRPTPGQARHVWREVREGVRWVYQGSGLATLAVATHVWFLGNAVLGAVVAPFALTTLGLAPWQLGLCAALTGAGGVVGAVTSSAGGRRWGTGGAVIVAHVASALGVVVMLGAALGHGPTLPVVLLAAGHALHGFGLGFSNSHEMAYRQALTPDALQARTNTTMRSLNRGVMVLGAPLGGLLAVQTTNGTGLVAAAVLFGLAALMLALSPFRHVRQDLTADD